MKTLNDLITTKQQEAEERFWKKVSKKASGCWEWTGTLSCGYGVFNFVLGGSKGRSAHRFSYEIHKGIIPKGMHTDHLCRNRACVNPEHLEVVTPRENALRGIGFGAQNAIKEVCVKGHPLDEKNTYRPAKHPEQRHCRACRKEVNHARQSSGKNKVNRDRSIEKYRAYGRNSYRRKHGVKEENYRV